MAAAVPQHVREFQLQISKAQMAQLFVQEGQDLLQAVLKMLEQQRKLPSQAGSNRCQRALERLKAWWAQRYGYTMGSLDECLQWSAVALARKYFHLAGWSVQTLQAQHVNDKEMLVFSLMGQEQAHGAWQADFGRSPMGNAYALAVALAPLGIQVHTHTELQFSVPEAQWQLLQARCVVKGNGQRLPAGQWVPAPLQHNPHAVDIAHWQWDESAVDALHQKAQQCSAQLTECLHTLAQFQQMSAHTLYDTDRSQCERMQAFAQAFAQAGQMPAYDWVLAVVPAVRAIARSRVARLLQRSSVLA